MKTACHEMGRATICRICTRDEKGKQMDRQEEREQDGKSRKKVGRQGRENGKGVVWRGQVIERREEEREGTREREELTEYYPAIAFSFSLSFPLNQVISPWEGGTIFYKSLHLAVGSTCWLVGWLTGSKRLHIDASCAFCSTDSPFIQIQGRKILVAFYWKHFKGWALHDFIS